MEVSGEAIAEDRIQLTLQLNEPGTIWCTPVALSSAAGTEVKNSNFGTSFARPESATLCAACLYFETCCSNSGRLTVVRDLDQRVAVLASAFE